MNKCLDSGIQEMLPDLAHGTLDQQSRIRVEAHLASCESCREDMVVIQTVKNAAVFAPTIDVQRVMRQIPPYRAIVPGVRPLRRSGRLARRMRQRSRRSRGRRAGPGPAS